MITYHFLVSMNKNHIKRRIDQRESFGLKCAKCVSLIEEPMVSQACLHRFCAPCVRDAKCCPVCGVSTRYKIDLNFALIVSKVKSRGKHFMKRSIVDVLCGDGANLSTFAENGRYSRMSTTIEKERERVSQPNNVRLYHDAEPSTSSSLIEGTNGNGIQNGKNATQMEGIVNYIPSTVCCSSPLPPIHHSKIVDSEIDVWNKSGNSLMCNRRSLCRDFVGFEPIVLWPDGENYRLNDLPKCLLRPRYLLIPPEATVAHMIGYLFKRAETEAAWKQQKYRVEMMQVEEEREELRLWMDPMRNIEYLIRDFKSNLQEEAYMLVVRKTQNDLNFNTNLIMAHPFKALPNHKLLIELIREHKNFGLRMENGAKKNNTQQEQMDRRQFGKWQTQCTIRPLKIVFRFVLH